MVILLDKLWACSTPQDSIKVGLEATGHSLAQFFAESEMVELTPESKELFDNWVSLTPEQKQAALQMIRAMNTK